MTNNPSGLLRGALIVVLMSSSVLLALQNRDLKQKVYRLQQLLFADQNGVALTPGDYVLEIRYQTLDGEWRSRSFVDDATRGAGKPVFVGLLRPDCEFCRHEVPYWNTISARKEYGADFLGISVGSRAETLQFVGDTGATFPIYLANDQILKQLHASGVPVLIRFSGAGRVEELLAGPQDTPPPLSGGATP